MSSPLALIKPKISICRGESKSSSTSLVSQAPCLKIHDYIGRRLVFSNHFDRIWLPHDELPPPFPKQTIASQKLMITVVWNPYGFQMIQSLPKRIKWAARYYSFSNHCSSGWRQSPKMMLHAENASPHVAKCVTEYMDHNSLKRALHVPCSPDLASSDCYLFGYAKHQLQGHGLKE
jgi:hypothetical protein